MLEFFRNNIGGLLGGIIVGVLAFAFAFSFGSQSRGWGEGQSEQFAAMVMGSDIADGVFQQAYNLQGGRNYGQNDPEATTLRLETLNGLIERELLISLADDIGVTASRDEAEDRIINSKLSVSRSLASLAQRIESNMFMDPAIMSRVLVVDGHRIGQSFKDDNDKFDLESYQKFVRHYLQTTEENFVEQQRREIIAERMRQIIAGSVRISADEVRQAYNRENDTAQIDYVRLIPSYFSDKLEPTVEELKQWAETHTDEVAQYYETNKFRYTNLEKMVRARHIMIKVPSEASEGEKKAAKTSIERLLRRAKAGTDFVRLAKTYSQNEKSAEKGGDLGFVKRGQMDSELDEVMFALAPGAMSDVVETKNGFHILKLEAVREGDVSLEEATQEIAEKLYRETKGKESAKSKGEELLAKLKVGARLEELIPASQAEGQAKTGLDLKVLASRSFTRFEKSIPGVGEAPDMVSATFQLATEGTALPEVYEVRGDYYVASLKERKKPSGNEFENLKDEFTSSLLSQKQGSWLLSRMNDIKKQAEEQGEIEIYYTPAKTAGGDQPFTIDLTKKSTGGSSSQEGAAAPKPAPDGDEQE
jgi:peptidyl-prolyl cis-trans isomerase D